MGEHPRPARERLAEARAAEMERLHRRSLIIYGVLLGLGITIGVACILGILFSAGAR